MEFRQLKYIYTVYECGSITKAAEKLFISQPSLSSFITKTEMQLGVKLFDRSQNKLTLTYAGEKYIKAAERILLIYDRMIKQLEDISENRKGRLRIGIPWQRLEYMAPTLLPRLHEEFGSIEVDIVPGNYSVLEEALRNRKVDFIIVPLLKPDENYNCVEIHRENIYAVTRRGYLSSSCLVEGRRDSVDLRAIADMPIFVLPESFSFRRVTEGLFEMYGITPSNLVEYPSPGSKFRTAAAGQGIDIVLKSNVEITKSVDPLDVFFIGSPPASVGVYAIFRKDAYISGVEKNCIRIIGELFG